MPKFQSKLQLRAYILAILNKYKSVEKYDELQLRTDINEFLAIEDKKYLTKILFDELSSQNSKYPNFCTLFLLECVDLDTFAGVAKKMLNNSNIDDSRKMYLIALLKQRGVDISNDEIENYLDDIDKSAQESVLNFLNDAINNPEVQIDLLDFYSNIAQNDKLALTERISADCSGDNLANAFSLLLYLDLDEYCYKIIYDILLNSNSKYAIDGLKILKNKSFVSKIENKIIDKKIKKLELKFNNYKNNSIILNSKYYKSYVSLIDGNSNFSLIFSRIDKNEYIDSFFVTINIEKGVTSCIGFYKILKANFSEIMKRLFSDSLPIKINPVILKSLLNHYLDRNIKTMTTIPYEIYIWKNMLNDIEDLNLDLSHYLNAVIDYSNISIEKLDNIFSLKVIDTWYYTYNQNAMIDVYFSEFQDKYSNSIDEIHDYTCEFVKSNLIKNPEFILDFKSKLLLQAYFSHLMKLKISPKYLYGICFDDKLIEKVLCAILEKSLYMFLNQYLNKNNEDIFIKSELKLQKKEILKIKNGIAKKWKLKKEL